MLKCSICVCLEKSGQEVSFDLSLKEWPPFSDSTKRGSARPGLCLAFARHKLTSSIPCLSRVSGC